MKPQSKVFGIGLSKTATSSLACALRILGYKTVSWNVAARVIGWPELYHADAATDTPCAAQFETLYHTFENSKFVYTTRDIDSWERSITNHTGMDTPRGYRKRWTSDRFWERWDWYNAFRGIQIHENLYADHDTWEEAYHAFDRRVRRFFEDKPDDRFLEVNICAGDGWEKLCPFLGVNTPDHSFPHKNASPSLKNNLP